MHGEGPGAGAPSSLPARVLFPTPSDSVCCVLSSIRHELRAWPPVVVASHGTRAFIGMNSQDKNTSSIPPTSILGLPAVRPSRTGWGFSL